MRWTTFIVPLSLLIPLPVAATEITTGRQLGRKFDPRAFYIRSGPLDAWRKTYSGPEYRPESQGKLMNLRLCQGLFDDEWMHERPFDPEKNTRNLIEALDFYKRHGIMMVNVSLQGGQAGYDLKVNGIARENGYKYGPEKGTYVSAFRPDGALKQAWLDRLESLLRATDRRGMIVNLMYLYQGQDEQFASTDAIDAAARNITDWLIDKNFRNVVIDVSNEWDLGGDYWDFDTYIPRHIVQLIELIRRRLQERGADFVLPVSASSDGRMNYPPSLLNAADIVLIHGNGRTPEEKLKRTAELKDVPRPVLMTEDDNGKPSTLKHLERDLASCSILFDRAAGWGYMPWVQAQRFPFRFMPTETGDVRDDMPKAARDMAYFHAVLDHIATLTLSQPVHPAQQPNN